MSTNTVLDAVVSHIAGLGFNQIKTIQSDTNKTGHILCKKSNKEFQPDISAEIKGSENLFEIEPLETEESPTQRQLLKWQIFSDYAQAKKGYFYLVIPEEKRPDISHELKKNNIKAEVLPY